MNLEDMLKKLGVDIDTSNMDEREKALLTANSRIALAQGEALSGDGFKQTIAETVSAAIDERLKPLGDRLDAVEAGGGGGKDKPGGNPEDKPGGGGDLASQITAAVTAATKPLADQLNEFKSERDGETKRGNARSLTERVLKEKYPNLREVDRLAITDSAVSSGVEKEEAVVELVKAHGERLKSFGVSDTERLLSADPVKEGATTGDNAATDAEAKKQEQINRIKNQKPLVRTVA